MRKIGIALLVVCCLIGCNEQKRTPKEMVKVYYQSLDLGDYNSIKLVISDSITLVEGDFVMPYDKGSFYEHFKWDSVFRTSYELLNIEEKNNQVFATVASKSIKNEFLQNNPLTCTFKISFKSGKISGIENSKCTGTDWALWETQRDSLVSWVAKTHPNLNGFVYDMTMKGAMNYVNAISLYKKAKESN